MASVNIYQAKANRSRLIQKAFEGEDIVTSQDMNSVARPIAINGEKVKRQPASMKDTLVVGSEFFKPFPEDELFSWE